ncbi:MAG: DUF1176 domain-containing protein [Synechococcus sp.]|nr:DUF1176 domain-containing protein [Synechococcus sp.]
MQKFYYVLPVAALIGSAIASSSFLSSRTTANTQLPGGSSRFKVAQGEISPTLAPKITPPIPVAIASPLEGSAKANIFQQVVAQQSPLGLCAETENLAANLDSSDVYQWGEDQYLVSVQCFMATYQGAYEFVYVDGETLTHSRLGLAGFPTFDPQTNLLSNSYKFNGAGSCFEETRYSWDGYSLQLVSATLIDGIPDGCAEMGVRSPAKDYLITADSVGPARLGMTFQEFQAQLPESATLEAVPLGVDLPQGWRVNLYGAEQFIVAFDDAENGENFPSNQAKLTWIMVKNPSYRTTAGVGPGTPLPEAIAQYGPATLSYNQEAESREFIQFENSLFTSDRNTQIFFRSNQWTISDYAGIYPDSQMSYHTTTDYADHAAIGAIWLSYYP